ncbi:MAG: PilN domain-containing protein [Actinomycetes bacterium]
MTTSTLSTSQLAALPRVNLLPPEIAERVRARKIQAGLGAAVALSVVGVAAGYVMAHSSATHAKSQLADAQAQGSQLQTQVAQYAGDENMRAQLTSEQAMLTSAMGSEVQWSHYLNDLTLRIPDNVWITNVTITEGASQQGAAAAATPAAGSDAIGSVNVTGVAFTHDDVATWLDSLAKEKGYANAFFSNSAQAFIGPRRIVNFTSTTQVTSDALSGRYTRPAGS